MTTQDKLISYKVHLSSDFHGSDLLHGSSAISQNDTWAALVESCTKHPAEKELTVRITPLRIETCQFICPVVFRGLSGVTNLQSNCNLLEEVMGGGFQKMLMRDLGRKQL